MLQSTGSQRTRHDWATEPQLRQDYYSSGCLIHETMHSPPSIVSLPVLGQDPWETGSETESSWQEVSCSQDHLLEGSEGSGTDQRETWSPSLIQNSGAEPAFQSRLKLD